MPSKPKPSEVVKATADYLTGYLGEVTDINSFVKNLDPKTNIRGLEDVLSYHFLRTGEWNPQTTKRREEFDIPTEKTAGITDVYGEPVGILDFISLLPSRLQSLNPEVTNRVNISDGEINGHIDWRQTIQYRCRTGDVESQRFACRVQKKTPYSTRNRVLFALLSTVRSVCADFERHVITGEWPTWFKEWGPNGKYREELNRILDTPHFETVDLQIVSVTDREIADVKKDRDRLYREAATLLEYYRGLGSDWFDKHSEYAISLLSLDLFHPEEENEGSDIFELYWLFRVLDCFDKDELEPFTLQNRGEYDGVLLARWKAGDSEYLLFNDWRGRYPYDEEETTLDLLDISPPPYSTSETEMTEDHAKSDISRVGYVEQHNKWILEAAFNQDSNPGRKTPDILLLEMDPYAANPTLKRVFIGEVKYSTELERNDGKEPNVIKGVRQLLEYGSYAKLGDDLMLNRGGSAKYIGSSPDPLRAPEVELGLFVGDADIIENCNLPGIQIKGWPDKPDHPFEDG